MAEDQWRMSIQGMTCTDCELHVTEALERAGARNVQADFRRGEARFILPEGVDSAGLALAVRAAGYRPVGLEAPGTPPRRAAAAGEYDLAIVGSGSAAFAAAIRARDQGARVVMVERGTLGGTCVNIGCIPSKALLRAAAARHAAGHHPFAGIATTAGPVDAPALWAQKDELVARLRKEKYEDIVEAYGWEVLRGTASFRDAATLEVDGQPLTARAYLLATGARPAVPAIPGLAEAAYLTSTTALSLGRVPASLAVIGSGYIALELGQLFARLGSRVTMMQRHPHLLKEYEPEIGTAVEGFLADEGIDVLAGVRYLGVETDGKTRRVRVTHQGKERVVEAEELLVATGRQPNTEELALARAGITPGSRGEIPVDEHLATANPRVFAAGDVTFGPQFVYVAAYQGGLAAQNALGADRRVDLATVPSVIFTDPSVATVGLTEAQARAAGHQVKVSILPLDAVPRALVNRDTRGLVKLVADAEDDRLLGAHLVADAAGEVIYAASLAVRYRLTVADLSDALAPYLTMAEGLRLAAQTFGRDVHLLSCCAG